MKHQSVEKHIEWIVGAAKDNIYYLCTSTGHMSNNQLFPVILADAQTSGVIDYEGIESKAARLFNVSISMLEKKIAPEFVDNGKGGKTRESELSYQNRIKTKREEMILVIEQIIDYLTADNFPFRYEILGDIDYTPVDFESQKYNLFGVQATLSVATNFNRSHCCIEFDENKIKTYNKSTC